MIKYNRQKLKRLLQRPALVFTSLCMLLSLMPSGLALAENTDKLFVSPTSGQMNIGDTFCVDIKSYAAVSTSNGTAIGDVTYESSKLQILSFLTSGKQCYNKTTTAHYGTPSIGKHTNRVSFNASRTNAPSGIAQVFAIKFKAKKAGSVTIGFTNGSRVNNATTEYITGAFKIVDPNPPSKPPAPNPTPTPAPPLVPSISKPTEEEKKRTDTVPDPTGIITGVSVDSAYTTATVSWKINGSKSKATFLYGSDYTKLENKTKVTKKSGNNFSAAVVGLEPGLRYYFTISGTGGGKNGEYSGTIITLGYPAVFTVTENNVPAENAVIRIGGLTRSASADGKLALGLAAGDYTVTISTSTSSMTANLSVNTKPVPTDGSAPATQTFSYNLTSSILKQGPQSGFSILAFLGILMVGLVVLGLGFFGFMAYRRRQFEKGFSSRSNGPSVIIDDGYNWQNHESSPDVSQSTPPEHEGADEHIPKS